MQPNAARDSLILSRLKNRLPELLPDFLRAQRWFGGKAGVIRSVALSEIVPVQVKTIPAYLTLLRVEYAEGHPQHYAVPLAPVPLTSGVTQPVLRLEEAGEPACVLGDALLDEAFSLWLIESIREKRTFSGQAGELAFVPGRALESLWRGKESMLQASVMKGEQSNTSIRYGDRLILKFFRRMEEGVCLDQEIGSFLTDKARFAFTPPLAGTIEYRRPGRTPVTLAILQGFVHNQGDAWRYTLESIEPFLARVRDRSAAEVEKEKLSVEQMIGVSVPSLAAELLGPFLGRAALLGKRTAGLHRALASDMRDPAFEPEPFSSADRQTLVASMTRLGEESLQLLQQRYDALSQSSRENAARLLALREEILSRFGRIETLETIGMRTRIHGDYHLGQVLVTASDFAIIDFEGEPERPLAERRFKRSPFADVAGMLRSFHYAASSLLLSGAETGRPDRMANRARWLEVWRGWVSATFLQAYLREVKGAAFVPQRASDGTALLQVFLLEKAVYELGYELKNRPGWLPIPLRGILDLLEPE